MEFRQLFVTAADVGIVRMLRHLAAMPLAVAVIVVLVVTHIRPMPLQAAAYSELSRARRLQGRNAPVRTLYHC